MATQGRIRQSLYEVLGVDPEASDDEVRAAYKTLARKYHPDLNQGNAQAEMMFKAVGRAYEVLGNVAKRAQYDETIHRESEQSQRGTALPKKRGVDFVLIAFGLMLGLAMIFFFIDTPKGIYFLVVAIALEIRTSIESLRSEVRRSTK